MVIKHYQNQERYKFGIRVLELALQKSGLSYRLESPVDADTTEIRGEKMVIGGQLDVQFLSTARHRETELIPIKFPLYRGILGLRLVLVKKSNSQILDAVTNVAHLRKYTGGHGKFWGDLPVYAANDLKVETNVIYESLFAQLINGRFDYFHRGISEIWDEQKRYEKDLVVADKVMLFYKHPVYYFVTKKKEGLARHITKGLDMALQDGSYEKEFRKEMDRYLTKGKVNGRNLVILKNPVVPDDAPPLDTSWWLSPSLQQQIRDAGL